MDTDGDHRISAVEWVAMWQGVVAGKGEQGDQTVEQFLEEFELIEWSEEMKLKK